MKVFRIVALVVAASLLPTVLWAAKPEFRAAWVTAWQDGILTPEQTDATIKAAKDANLNAIFVQVRKTADAYYNSSIEPRGENIAGPADYDPLGYFIDKAKEQGLEVHAWAVIFRIWKGDSLPESACHIYYQQREWLSRSQSGVMQASDGVWLDPGLPEVQDYTVKVLMDLVSKYNIDGLHLDYIRYPGSEWGYNAQAVERFNKATGRSGNPAPGDSAWCNWRRKQVTETVRRIYQEVITCKPHIKVTAATIPWGNCPSDFTKATPYIKVLQDWRTWMKEGILDANVVMNYKDDTTASGQKSFRGWIDGANRWRYGRHAYIGQWFKEDTASATQQILAGRKKGVDGFSGFYFNDEPWRPKLVQALRSTVFQTAAPVPKMSWKSTEH